MCGMEVLERNFKVNVPDDRGNVPVARDILDCVREFQGSVYIEKDGRSVSAGSMVGILSLVLQNGDIIKVTCSGKDEFAMNLCLEKLGAVIS